MPKLKQSEPPGASAEDALWCYPRIERHNNWLVLVVRDRCLAGVEQQSALGVCLGMASKTGRFDDRLYFRFEVHGRMNGGGLSERERP